MRLDTEIRYSQSSRILFLTCRSQKYSIGNQYRSCCAELKLLREPDSIRDQRYYAMYAASNCCRAELVPARPLRSAFSHGETPNQSTCSRVRTQNRTLAIAITRGYQQKLSTMSFLHDHGRSIVRIIHIDPVDSSCVEGNTYCPQLPPI